VTDDPKDGDGRAEDGDGRAEDGGGRSVRRLIGGLPGLLTATVTLVAAALGVLFLLVPSLKPLPRDQISASLSVPTVEGAVSEMDWATRQYPGNPVGALNRLIPNGFDPKTDGLITGMVVYVRLQVNGFQHRSIKLRARAYDTSTNEVATNVNLSQIYPSAADIQIDAPSRSSVQLMFLTDLTKFPGRHFIRVEAYDDGGILSYADSPPIGIG